MPDTGVMAKEGPRIEDDHAIPAALNGEGQAARDAVQRIGVRNVGRLLLKQVAIRVTRHPDVIEVHCSLRLDADSTGSGQCRPISDRYSGTTLEE